MYDRIIIPKRYQFYIAYSLVARKPGIHQKAMGSIPGIYFYIFEYRDLSNKIIIQKEYQLYIAWLENLSLI